MTERAYMVMGEDENGDAHLFSTSDIGRAEATYRQFQEDLIGVRANWLEFDKEPPPIGD